MQQPTQALMANNAWNMNRVFSPLPTPGAQLIASNTPFDAIFASDFSALKNEELKLPGAFNMASVPALQPSTFNAAECANQPETTTVSNLSHQESLDTFPSPELMRTKLMGGSQTLFADALEQLSAKEESLPSQAALYSLPSMQFLESLLDEMDSRNTSAGCKLAEPPLYLPVDSFDLPGLDAPGAAISDLAQLGLPPLPRRVHSASAAVGNTLGPSHHQNIPVTKMHPGSYVAPTAGSAAPTPQKGVQVPHQMGPAAVARQAASALEELYGFEDPEVTFQTSKGGRMRKVTSFTGAKRKLKDMTTQVSAPAALAGEAASQHFNQESGMTSYENQGDNEVTNDARKALLKTKKTKRTVCVNCGSHQTPQWRCGPLGPRTLCNACGVRYKKGLPLNCWPLREGMVLPPGAEIPASVQVPAGINIVTQPLYDAY